MSSTPNQQESETPAPAPARGMKRIIPLVLASSVSLFAGGVAGLLVAGPFLAKRAVAQAESVAKQVVAEMASGEHGAAGGHSKSDKKGKDGEHGAGGVTPTYTLDNLVLNPAQSGGTRFLVASLALQVSDSTFAETMKQRDPEVRDAVLRVLGAKSVDQLSDMTSRPALKQELTAAVDSVFGDSVVSAIYFPQFVIQ